MDIQSSVATWASLVVTTIGLGGLITQASAISDQMDPFYSARSADYLGVWFSRQRHFPWWRIGKPPPRGPVMLAGAKDGFCGRQIVYLMRLPPASTGKAGWSTLLAMFYADMPLGPVPPRRPSTTDEAEKASALTMVLAGKELVADAWPFLSQKPLILHSSDACIAINRATLITMLIMTNARPVFEYSSAEGYRAGYASYAGQWYITWPIGKEAVIKFAMHDSLHGVELMPRYFPVRVDRCCEMVCGIVSSRVSDVRVAFCGRKAAGTYKLEFGKQGFQGAHGSRHLYNMMGGKAHQYDYMNARPLRTEQSASASLTLHLPSTEGGRNGPHDVQMIVPPLEEDVIRHALDCLSWTSVSWSLHRGLRDLLIAYAKPVMDSFRPQMGQVLLQAVQDHIPELLGRGWEADFLHNSMAGMAATSFMAGVGNSGDAVRVVTDVVTVLVGDWDVERLDNAHFWRRDPEKRPQPGQELDHDAIVAMTKVFVLEWSQDFNYQCYHQFPITMLLA